LPPTLGEHVEQNVSLATSSDARLRRPVRVTVLRRADVCAMELGPAPRKHAPPQAVYPRRLMGVWGLLRHLANSGPDFRSSSSFRVRMMNRHRISPPDFSPVEELDHRLVLLLGQGEPGGGDPALHVPPREVGGTRVNPNLRMKRPCNRSATIEKETPFS